MCATELACLQSIESLMTVGTSSSTAILGAINSHVDWAQLGASPEFMTVLGIITALAVIRGLSS